MLLGVDTLPQPRPWTQAAGPRGSAQLDFPALAVPEGGGDARRVGSAQVYSLTHTQVGRGVDYSS